jgi:hypothetical protein
MTKTSTERAATSEAQFQTIEAVRTCTADVLGGFDSPLTRYESGLQQGFAELGRLLDPAGYDRRRSWDELIAGLQDMTIKTSKARLQSIKDVREYLDLVFAGNKEVPSDNRYLYGYEDAHWFLWSYVDPIGFDAAKRHLPH